MSETAVSSEPLIEMHRAAIAAPRDPQTLWLQEINWRVNAGSFWAIGGSHSSGKSLLLACAAGILRPKQGDLRLFGQPLFELDERDALKLLLRIGLVFEGDGRLFNQMSVAENVALPLRYHFDCTDQETSTRVDAVLEATGLSAEAATPAGRIARAFRQRVGLARALVLQPDVLLVDNPLSFQGPLAGRWWCRFLKELAKGHPVMGGRPVTVVVAGDDLRPWRHLAGEFGLLADGRLECFSSGDALASSGHPALDELLHPVNPTETI
jgi:ABC-type transporter Mla maintaining outer membrane lipid asymmetry ATPase subunit MlaF